MPLSAEDQREYDEANEAKEDIAVSTRRTYDMYWKRFDEWCEGKGYTSLPAEPDVVDFYLRLVMPKFVKRDGKPYEAPSYKQTVAAIKRRHGEAGHLSPTDHMDVKATLKKVMDGYVGTQADALDDEFVAAVRRTACIPRQHTKRLENPATALARGLRETAVVSFLSYSGMRVGEVHLMDWQHITVKPDGTAEVYIPAAHTKTRRERRLSIPSHVVHDLEAIRMGRQPEDAVFATTQTPRATTARIRGWVRDAARAAGYDPKTIKLTPHGGRRAAVERFIRNEAPTAIIQNHTGHQNLSMVNHYARNMSSAESQRYIG